MDKSKVYWKQAYDLVCVDRDTTRLERDNALHCIRDLEAQLAEAGNLLAVIHRDGGHHTGAVGFVRSCQDAQATVLERVQEIDRVTGELAEARKDGDRLDHVIDNFELINIDGWADYADYSAMDLGPEENETAEVRKAWRKYLDSEIDAAMKGGEK